MPGIRCRSCDGDPSRAKTCSSCRGTGNETIYGCPQEHVTADVWEALAAAGMAEQGAWPVAGGWLDQTAIFVQTYRTIHAL